MATLWLKLRDTLSRLNPSPESRGSGRGTPRAAPGKAVPWTGRSWYWAAGLGLVLLVLHLFLFVPVPRVTLDFPARGDIAEREIRAPFTFPAPLPDGEVQMQRFERVVKVPPVLRRLAAASGSIQAGRMELWLESLRAELGNNTTLAEKVGILTLQFPSLNRNELRRLLSSADGDSLIPRMRRAWRQVMDSGLVDMLPPGRYNQVAIVDESLETQVKVDQVVTQSRIEERLIAGLRSAGLPPVEAVDAASVLRQFLIPNLVYDPEETESRQETVRDAVPTSREFIRGERIIDQGVRVTEQQALFLAELERLIRERGGGVDNSDRLIRFLSRGLLLALALGLFGWLGMIHFSFHLRRLRTLTALFVVLALFLLGAAVSLERPGLGPMAVPIVLLSLISTVLYKEAVGYTTTLLALTLLAVLPGVSAAVVFSWFVLGMVTVISVRRIQKRSQFYQTILLLTALSVTLIFLFNVGSGEEVAGLGSKYLVGIFAPVLSVAFGLFLLPVVEPLVGVCSDLTLLELSDLNHPLLQRMALEAQGTYHHSQVVGQLGEHAARAIDANALLTRVGALFHDIGKMQKSEYYVENQHRGSNKHDELSPSMSALVIAAHVKDGIELGRKWRLPQAIIDFIPQHHGTMVMEFFYHKALEADGNETVKVDDFRYPGPKPRSRETAILMLADAVEAATRSLGKPTPSRIKEITKQIIDKRMLSGELDESGLSLSDLAMIREAFIPLLTGIHHSRIVYPGQKDPDAERGPEKVGDRKARS